jgi:hypothetical protein
MRKSNLEYRRAASTVKGFADRAYVRSSNRK